MTKTTAVKEARRRQLIEAMIAVICRNGYSNTTLAQVAGDAGLSPRIVNFYFKSKEQLLVATLEHLADEYERVGNETMVTAGGLPAAALAAMLEARYFDQTRDLVASLVAEGGYRGIDATIVATGPKAMIDGFLRDYGLPGEGRALRAARYPNGRINRQVLDDDIAILVRVQRGLSSRSFETGHLADSEIGLRRFPDWLRAALPVARLHRPPASPIDIHSGDLTRA